MKLFELTLAVIMGLFIYNVAMNTYVEYQHKMAVAQCQNEVNAPKWATPASDWACDRWAK